MTIDERLERLTERHEALAQSLQILTTDVHALQARTENLVTVIESQSETSENLLASVTMLYQLAKSHDERLGRLEGL